MNDVEQHPFYVQWWTDAEQPSKWHTWQRRRFSSSAEAKAAVIALGAEFQRARIAYRIVERSGPDTGRVLWTRDIGNRQFFRATPIFEVDLPEYVPASGPANRNPARW